MDIFTNSSWKHDFLLNAGYYSISNNEISVMPKVDERKLNYLWKQAFSKYVRLREFNSRINNQQKEMKFFMHDNIYLVPKYFSMKETTVKRGTFHHITAGVKPLRIFFKIEGEKYRNIDTSPEYLFVFQPGVTYYFIATAHLIFKRFISDTIENKNFVQIFMIGNEKPEEHLKRKRLDEQQGLLKRQRMEEQQLELLKQQEEELELERQLEDHHLELQRQLEERQELERQLEELQNQQIQLDEQMELLEVQRQLEELQGLLELEQLEEPLKELQAEQVEQELLELEQLEEPPKELQADQELSILQLKQLLQWDVSQRNVELERWFQ